MTDFFNSETLTMLGYDCETDGDSILWVRKVGKGAFATAMAGSPQFEDVRHMCGRLDNIDYMAPAIDMFDGAITKLPGGQRAENGYTQLHHLFSIDRGAAAMFYVALRRFQRAGDLPRLRAGLALLIAYDRHHLDGRDAVALLLGVDCGDVQEKMARQMTLPTPAKLAA